MLLILFFFVLEYISGLAFEYLAYGFQRGEPYGFYFPCFKDGQVNRCEADPFCQFVGTHLSLGKHNIQVDDDRHIIKLDPVLPAITGLV